MTLKKINILECIRFWGGGGGGGSSVVECRTHNQVSPGSNPSLLPF